MFWFLFISFYPNNCIRKTKVLNNKYHRYALTNTKNSIYIQIFFTSIIIKKNKSGKKVDYIFLYWMIRQKIKFYMIKQERNKMRGN